MRAVCELCRKNRRTWHPSHRIIIFTGPSAPPSQGDGWVLALCAIFYSTVAEKLLADSSSMSDWALRVRLLRAHTLTLSVKWLHGRCICACG